ncbi:MAG TPA: nucleoside hydrolase [Thermomicrobiales bacterium]|nr:nucleoside hydrolase [Thermomicrobiales bacterium]
MSATRRPLLMDVDTGVDDAMAIALASRLDRHELIGITTVAGNVPVEAATRNTRTVAGWLGLDVPIYAGLDRPLVRALKDAREHHGEAGLGDWQPEVELAALSDVVAPEAIVRLAREYCGEITFVFVGPLTNLAVALSLEPRLPELVDRLVIMGGAFFNPGNVSRWAEFNIFVDPDAAQRVADAGFRAIWVGLDVTHQTTLDRKDWEVLAGATDHGAILVREMTRRILVDLSRPRANLHDPLAVAVAEDPSIIGLAEGLVVVDTTEPRRGRARLAEPAADDARASVCRTVDRDRFRQLFARVSGELPPLA